jgi:RNA polymerase sigma-70 factor (ECF subfamily)
MNVLEKTLVDSLKKGNHKSFELVFKTYYSRLCTYAFDYTKQLETAEDIVKDFFLDFWQNREKITIKTSMSGYLFRSVHNACINYLEREKRKNKTLLVEDITVVELKIRQPLSPDYPVGNILAKELEEQINLQIEKLPPQCREIFILSRFEGLSHKKISEKLNISENTVKVQIFRALKKIKEALPHLFILLFSFFK